MPVLPSQTAVHYFIAATSPSIYLSQTSTAPRSGALSHHIVVFIQSRAQFQPVALGRNRIRQRAVNRSRTSSSVKGSSFITPPRDSLLGSRAPWGIAIDLPSARLPVTTFWGRPLECVSNDLCRSLTRRRDTSSRAGTDRRESPKERYRTPEPAWDSGAIRDEK